MLCDEIVWIMVCVCVILCADVVCDVVWGGTIDLKLFGGFAFRQTDERTDIRGCRSC